MTKRKKMHILAKIGIGIGAVFAVLLLDGFCTSGHGFFYRPDRSKTITLSYVKHISTALMLYAADNDDRLPHKFSTHQDLSNSASQFFSSAYYVPKGGIPETRNPNGGTIIPNRLLAGMLLSDVAVPETTAMIYGSRVFPDGCLMVGFVDSGVRCMEDLRKVNFDPSWDVSKDE
ncbi:MAG: hypothetical protein IH944_08030 [Armatimonadetes bacterium]|nr:hypothetical protein [Armatimonadota bacterium]